MNNILSRVVLVSCAATALSGQQKPGPALCPTVLGIYPVDFKIDEPLNRRSRFEIRACGDGRHAIQLLGFKANANRPSLMEAGSNIELLIQAGTFIVVQMTAGSSSPTLVAQFQKGIPTVMGREDGVGGVTYSEDHNGGNYAIITIPQKTFPDASGKSLHVPPHRYRLKMYD